MLSWGHRIFRVWGGVRPGCDTGPSGVGVGWGPQLRAGLRHPPPSLCLGLAGAGHRVALGGQPRGGRGKGRTVGQDLKEDRPEARRVPSQTRGRGRSHGWLARVTQWLAVPPGGQTPGSVPKGPGWPLPAEGCP